MNRTLVALGTAALVLAGCSENAPSEASDSSTTPAPTSTTGTPGAPVRVGTAVTVSAGTAGLQDLQADVTVFAVNQNVAPDAIVPPSGGHWAGADVQTCLKKSFKTFTVGWNDWSVSDAQNGQYRPSDQTYNQFPTPQYPFSQEPVAVGECVRGWVVFAVAYGVDITTVKFKPSFSPPVFWSAA